MNKHLHPIVAREGWTIIGISVVVGLFMTAIAGWAAFPFWLAVAFFVQFFRDPPRAAIGDGKSVLSPADGRIVAVEKTRDPYINRDAVKVSVFMNLFNVHSNRSPVDCEVVRQWYNPGKFLSAELDKSSTENERNALWLKTADGHDITCVQVAGLLARRILSYPKLGERLVRGQRYGFIRFGSRVDVYLPPDTRIDVAIGEKVFATTSQIAQLP
ncbi:MAG: phosphatidylserine decarboxylase [Rhodocyclaceae bacterium]